MQYSGINEFKIFKTYHVHQLQLKLLKSIAYLVLTCLEQELQCHQFVDCISVYISENDKIISLATTMHFKAFYEGYFKN